MTFRIKFSLTRKGENLEELLVKNPKEFLNTVKTILDSEVLAKSFLCTLLTYARRDLNMGETPTCEEFIEWFEDGITDEIINFMNELITRKGLRSISR